MADAATRIVVGAADYLAQEGILRALETAADAEVVSVRSSIDGLREATEAAGPDVVVTTLALAPDYADEGIVFAAALRKTRPATGVVVLGEQSDAPLALALFDGRVSARAYLLRERIQTADELVRAVREVARGRSVIDPTAVAPLLGAASDRRVDRSGILTAREREVLALVA